MSALPIPPPYRAPFCKVNLSFFHHLLKIHNYAQLKCFALILVETIGSERTGPNRHWAEIPIDMFVSATGVSEEWIYTALSELDQNYKWIKVRKNDRGRKEYSINDAFIQEIEGAGKEKVQGRCPDCKEIGQFDTRFVKIPHAALRKLGACVSPTAFKVTLTVFMYTADWKEGFWNVKPKELCSNDFERLADLDDRQISNGVAEAMELGIIGRQLRKGRANIYWAIPDGLMNLERRPMRSVTPSQGGVKHGANDRGKESAETQANPAKSTAIESGAYFYGRCSSCGHFVDVEPVTEEELVTREAEKPPRAGPGREKRRSASDTQRDKVIQVAQGLFPGLFKKEA